MISQVVDPPERLREEAQTLAEKITRNSPAAMAATKRALWGALEHGLTDACKAGAVELVSMWGHPDQVEGPAAFAEKREPAGPHRRLQNPPLKGETENRREGLATMYETLKIERHGPVGWLINNRPERLNAMNNAIRDEFAEAWKELDADPAVRVIVHTGEGKAFQTGVDVIEIASDGIGFERYRESSEKFDFHFTSWHNGVWKPVITAVNGICAGGGFHWIADADIVIAASDATFLDPTCRSDRWRPTS